tara:strand:+ start:392 stop:508 length:117 start_codon:yes stop_codon:yes gene_type:complete
MKCMTNSEGKLFPGMKLSSIKFLPSVTCSRQLLDKEVK